MTRLSYIVAIISIALMCVSAQEYYSYEFHNVDTTSMLQDNNLRDQYYACLMGTSPCQIEDAIFLKEILDEAIRTNCRRCTPQQKQYIKLLEDWYIKNKPEQWEVLVAQIKT